MFLSCNNITFKYSDHETVLDSVSLNIEKGRSVSVVGVSGCGKSTLLRVISGILPSEREGHLQGKIEIDGMSPDEYRRHGKLAFMFQEPALMPNLSIKANVGLSLRVKGISDNGRVDEIIETIGLSKYSHYLPQQLSGGMKTRVALARSFVTGPELMLLDEPFSALDIAWKSRLYVELEELGRRYGTTIVVVTHDVQEALLLSDEVLVMSSRGHIKERHSIASRRTVGERTIDVPGFMNEVYSNYLIPIQTAIIADAKQLTHPSGQK